MKPAIVGERVEVGRPAQHQRILNDALEMAVRALDRAILVGNPTVVAGGCHAVVGAERVVSAGEVGARFRIEVTECGGEAVAAMLTRRSTEQPERVLQSFGEGDVAFAAEHDMGVFEARPDQPEVKEAMIEPFTGDGDAMVVHVGKVRQPLDAGLVGLSEDDISLRAVDRPPGANPSLQRPADTLIELGMPP